MIKTKDSQTASTASSISGDGESDPTSNLNGQVTGESLTENIHRDPVLINVTIDNFEYEIDHLTDLADEYPYITFDTEFPGIVLDPLMIVECEISEANYQQLKLNVNYLKLIQVGIALHNANGEEAPFFWQFNMRWDVNTEPYAPDSIQLLVDAGINFEALPVIGIEPEDLGEKLTTTGLVLSDNPWISFHGLYDFGYMIRLLSSQPLPDTRAEFFELLSLYFPNRCDIKFLLRNTHSTGLQHLADLYRAPRVGCHHQGGSDAHLTSRVFRALSAEVQGLAFDETHEDFGGLYGLSSDETYQYEYYKASPKWHINNAEQHHMYNHSNIMMGGPHDGLQTYFEPDFRQAFLNPDAVMVSS